jgi:hypothetical protein
MTKITKTELKKKLNMRLGCTIQHTGYPCNSCFHSLELGISDMELHELWEALLLFRGDYKPPEIPIGEAEMEKRIKRLYSLLDKKPRGYKKPEYNPKLEKIILGRLEDRLDLNEYQLRAAQEILEFYLG